MNNNFFLSQFQHGRQSWANSAPYINASNFDIPYDVAIYVKYQPVHNCMHGQKVCVGDKLRQYIR